MGKGTPSMGKKHKITHIRCRRCGKHAYHVRKKSCAACGYGKTKRIRRYNWQNKKLGKNRLV
ncbi:MAG: 50S ribosomal protein L37e [Candidatus Jordarchaeum sp.]|uniref:50S ribosomal protein L37e n=1 Tax=Candidatus Jordarchaeum sp. TaxID=2823881 RepID=UPI00404B4721